MKHSHEDSDSPSSPGTLSFSGSAALLLLVAAFCVYPVGEQLWACVLAALAFVSLSLATPSTKRARVRADHELRRRSLGRRREMERDG